ncbi:hypothetical protein [Citrobacter pasteurii]|nr:hypothetical protein [Citrobacter pasteurii]
MAICIPRFCMAVREYENIPAIHHQSAVIICTLKTNTISAADIL